MSGFTIVCALYYSHFMCGMQRIVYAVLLQYCCSVVSLLQPANRLLWLVIVEYNVLFTVHYVWLRHGMLFTPQRAPQYGMYKQHFHSIPLYFILVISVPIVSWQYQPRINLVVLTDQVRICLALIANL